ncbi:NAD(P)/FAD-dependent oxidoreductase [Amycolatopsis sp. NPDC098790]|uniref:NAD(P)/FAD-dependent oxidoreductase n=1 Tax=Amycolatopsis sp. NPDC098790 TaxID=3363939 RepID=UPI003825B193
MATQQDLTSVESTPDAWRRTTPSNPIVVIGAGIVGCSAAYHLLKAGARDVTVLDRNEPGGGTTAAGAGFVALWAAGMAELGAPGIDLERYSLEFYRRLHQEGHAIDYRNDGNLVLALTQDKWENVVRPIAEHEYASPGTKALSPTEVAELTGVVDPGAVAGGVLMPSGIQLDTGKAVGALTQLITSMGGRIETGVTVEGFTSTGGRTTAVRTSAGDFPCAAVVVAAGAWTNSVLAGLGAQLPLVPVVATRIVTEPCGVPGSMPTIQCREFPLWIRESGGGFTWGTTAGYVPLSKWEDPANPLLPGRPRDSALFEALLDDAKRIATVFPALADAAVKSWLQGLPVYTADGQLVIGRLADHPDVVVLGGDNETGVSHGPSMGRVAAELVQGTDTFTDINRFRPDRFDSAPVAAGTARKPWAHS